MVKYKYRIKYKKGWYYTQVKWFIFWFTLDWEHELHAAEDIIRKHKEQQHPIKYWYYN